MKITNITTQIVSIPLNTTFRTALRTVTGMENVLVTIHTDESMIGFGSAAPATVITGETVGSIVAGIGYLKEHLLGMDILAYETLFQKLNRTIKGNMSAKAAVDMALHDLLAKAAGLPLYQFLGGPVQQVSTDITISLDEAQAMKAKSRERQQQGFSILKIKVGGAPDEDITRLHQIREALDDYTLLRLDANQGWNPKQALQVADLLEKEKFPIDLIEQPVTANDFEGLKFVRDNCPFPVYADESMFTPFDALRLISMNAVDGINIKLMKCGGLYNALKIAAISETAGIPCMIGSMMECSVSVTAAAHLAAARNVIDRFDLDSPLFCSVNPAVGGLSYRGSRVELPETPGLGIEHFKE